MKGCKPMPTGVYQTSAQCPFYKHDNGQKHRITCEGLIEESCLALVFQRRKDYQTHITTFCCEHYKRCEVYRMLMGKYEEDKI